MRSMVTLSAIIFPRLGNGQRRVRLDHATGEAGFTSQAAAAQLILLADRSKIGEISRVRLCTCPDIDVLVTDKGGHPLLAALERAGVKRLIHL
jgi:DeoR/GlpR family transcriptional regulator of sugar metabolism